MKVFILGATGSIGLPVACALSRAGHEVYGLTRTKERAKQLAAEEINPIIGDSENREAWIGLISEVDVVIESLGGTTDDSVMGPAVFNAVSAAAKQRPAGMPKLTYIYTSGAWTHGDDRKNVVTDTTPITNPVRLVKWRPAHEQAVLNDPVLNSIIIRPAFLYGGDASLLAPLFESASEGKVKWYDTPGGRFSVIHCEDLADLYVRVAEKAQLLGGMVFDAATNQTESVDDFLQKLVEVSGAQGPYEYMKPSNLFEEALASTVMVRPYLARSLLNWEPRMPGFVDGLPRWYSAWQASGKGAGHWSKHLA
ncbi:hypothetical protein EVG20_g3979 [Dentipellis fragilis]|uniref:NAD(P)-binding domain-containing protein n=1 Tax=Dentipellis fragilis TaxID=205917 RepID=A0A4Y9YY86_9AGAM|nr:hypothetical protein EVG20_g3979 [Dentipellis fragilis]